MSFARLKDTNVLRGEGVSPFSQSETVRLKFPADRSARSPCPSLLDSPVSVNQERCWDASNAVRLECLELRIASCPEIEPLLVEERGGGVRVVGDDSQHRETLIAVFQTNLLQCRQLVTANAATGRPERQEHRVAPEIAEADKPPRKIRQLEVGRLPVGNPAGGEQQGKREGTQSHTNCPSAG